MMRALALLDRNAEAGWIGDHARERGIRVVPVHRSPDERPPRLEGFDLVLSLGSEWSVADADRNAWIGHELRLLREASDLGVPVLGICFGAQALAKALCGDVWRAGHPEIGWVRVGPVDTSIIPDTLWFTWHYDVFRLPASARLLAANDCSVQAYAAGRSLGVQFHPEVTPGMIRGWAAKGGERLRNAGIDAVAMLEESDALAEPARTACLSLFSAFMAAAEA
jgi:GMP synthase-like glutamine amidotransferase